MSWDGKLAGCKSFDLLHTGLHSKDIQGRLRDPVKAKEVLQVFLHQNKSLPPGNDLTFVQVVRQSISLSLSLGGS